jgi:hypothetical protein
LECSIRLSPGSFAVGDKLANTMLSHCANPHCAKPFLRLREGKLFLVEIGDLTRPGVSALPGLARARQPKRQIEHYWLCDECAAQWTLIYDEQQGVTLIPVRRSVLSVRSASKLGISIA